jgi:hypothetical protein
VEQNEQTSYVSPEGRGVRPARPWDSERMTEPVIPTRRAIHLIKPRALLPSGPQAILLCPFTLLELSPEMGRDVHQPAEF